MAKLSKATRATGPAYYFYCPGCKNYHVFDSRWQFNGDLDKPTFSPSLLCNPDHAERRCHSFVRDGKIEFLSDCYHELAGQMVEMQEDTLDVDY